MALFQQDLKDIKRLHLKKYRHQEKLFLAEGTKIVFELLQSKIKPKIIIISKDWQDSNSKEEILFHRIEELSDKEFKKISSQKNPEGIMAVCEIPEFNLPASESNEWMIALDFLQDPGNLGTIIRIADWFGINTILCSTNTTDAYSPKVVQATMASLFRVNVVYTHLADYLSNTTLPVYAADLNGQSVYESKGEQAGIIVIGNESNGISEELRPFIDKYYTIPKLGKAESLNAGVATGIILSHLVNS